MPAARGFREPPVYDWDKLYDIIDAIVEVADARGVSGAQVALAWLLGRPGVTSVIIGGRNQELRWSRVLGEVPAFAEVVRSVRNERAAGVLLIEHNMGLIMEICDRIHVLDQGRTLAEGTPAEIRGNLDVGAAYLGESAVQE